VIGPVEGSVFVRDCKRCRLAVACAQLRLRDCLACDLLLRCRTRPVIEASGELRIGCWAHPYSGLAGQMAAAGLSPWHNFWSDIHDFTPEWSNDRKLGALTARGDDGISREGAGTPLGGIAQSTHWQPLPTDTGLEQLLPELAPDAVQRLLPKDRTLPMAIDAICAPRTAGAFKTARAGSSFLFLLLPKKSDTGALLNWVAQHTDACPYQCKGDAASNSVAFMLRSNEAQLDRTLAHRIATAAGWGDPTESQLCGSKASCVGLELDISSETHLEAVKLAVSDFGGFITLSDTAAALFRHAGVDG
jgi:Tubulin binding cofactor C